MFIIEVGSADVLSSLSTHILPLALFSVSHFSHHPLTHLLMDLSFNLPLNLSTDLNVSLCANHHKVR